ncbi:hypothetical protein DRO54_05360 [Candidatus Bathyarchaeota archaeon]|nr:MAG: hypothetical protein DRO54_05360 [Candidatus Bathyarchaeota archaeon]
MGGKKKLSLTQMERLQARRERERRARSQSVMSEKKTTNVLMPEINDNLINEIRKMKVITPFAVASKFDLRISVAKDLLEELERKKIIELVSRSRKTRVYKVAA